MASGASVRPIRPIHRTHPIRPYKGKPRRICGHAPSHRRETGSPPPGHQGLRVSAFAACTLGERRAGLGARHARDGGDRWVVVQVVVAGWGGWWSEQALMMVAGEGETFSHTVRDDENDVGVRRGRCYRSSLGRALLRWRRTQCGKDKGRKHGVCFCGVGPIDRLGIDTFLKSGKFLLASV